MSVLNFFLVRSQRNTLLGVGCAALLAWASHNASATQAQPHNPDRDEMAVLSALITHGLGPDNGFVVIDGETTGDPAAIGNDNERTAELFETLGIGPQTIQSWRDRNNARFALDRPFNLAVTYRLLAREALAEIFDGDDPEAGWERFSKAFPEAPGLVRVSRVGFSNSGDEALVYVEHQCGAECGAGRLARLIREGDTWTVSAGVFVWLAR